MDLAQAEGLFDRIYAGVEGYRISHTDRAARSDDRSLTYGEIVPADFHRLLVAVGPKPGESFVDLGSGIGKALIMAALTFPFRKIVGVELLPGLVTASTTALAKCRAELPDVELPPFDIRCGSLLDADLSDADIVFAHATSFEPELVQRMEKKLVDLHSGARVLVVSQHLSSDVLEPIGSHVCEMEWGETFVDAYRRT